MGTGYVLTATPRRAETGRSLASFRETARSHDLIPAMDRLSRRTRKRMGESFRSIHAAPNLERVTTESLPALHRDPCLMCGTPDGRRVDRNPLPGGASGLHGRIRPFRIAQPDTPRTHSPMAP